MHIWLKWSILSTYLKDNLFELIIIDNSIELFLLIYTMYNIFEYLFSTVNYWSL